MWGLLPLYWRLLNMVPSAQLVCHRIIWSSLLLLVVVPLLVRGGKQGGVSELFAALRSGRVWAVYAAAAGMISLNWFAFIWAVNHDRVLEASLGYYINPLLNVLLGVLLLGERLRSSQWTAVGIAAVGVAVMAIAGGGLPWVALVMASTFAVYGLVKKKAPLPSLAGLMLETVILLFPALAFVVLAESRGVGAFGHHGLGADGLMIGGGFLTVLPLALFAIAARRVPLSTIGVLQYVGPTLQFFVGAVLLGEPFGGARLIGFACVWSGLLLYLFSLRPTRQRQPTAPPASPTPESPTPESPTPESPALQPALVRLAARTPAAELDSPRSEPAASPRSRA